MSSYGISCQSAWDSLTCNLPQHTPIYSLHTPSWMRQPDNTPNIWIPCIRVPPWKQSQWKNFWLFTEKENNDWLHFCFVFPAAVLATFYAKIKTRGLVLFCFFCLPPFSQVSFMVLPLPALSKNESLSCAFGTLPAEPAIVESNRITCQSPPPMLLPPSPAGSGEWFCRSSYQSNFSPKASCWSVNMQIHTGE